MLRTRFGADLGSPGGAEMYPEYRTVVSFALSGTYGPKAFPESIWARLVGGAGASWEPLGGLLGASWGALGAFCGVLGLLLAV